MATAAFCAGKTGSLPFRGDGAVERARGPSWQRRPTDVCAFQSGRFKGSRPSACGEGRAGGGTLACRLRWPGARASEGAPRASVCRRRPARSPECTGRVGSPWAPAICRGLSEPRARVLSSLVVVESSLDLQRGAHFRPPLCHPLAEGPGTNNLFKTLLFLLYGGVVKYVRDHPSLMPLHAGGLHLGPCDFL